MASETRITTTPPFSGPGSLTLASYSSGVTLLNDARITAWLINGDIRDSLPAEQGELIWENGTIVTTQPQRGIAVSAATTTPSWATMKKIVRPGLWTLRLVVVNTIATVMSVVTLWTFTPEALQAWRDWLPHELPRASETPPARARYAAPGRSRTPPVTAFQLR